MLELDGVDKRYRGRPVLAGVSFSVAAGEIVALVGPNGAGKTTCLAIAAGLAWPDAGRVLLDGAPQGRTPLSARARSGLGFLPQESSVFRRLSVEDNLLAVLELGPRRADAARIAAGLLDELHLGPLRRARAETLSGGERRKLELARALATGPRLLLLDEPFAGLDPLAIEELAVALARLRTRGVGVLLTDHNVRAALALADRAVFLADGRVGRVGTPTELRADDAVRQRYLGAG